MGLGYTQTLDIHCHLLRSYLDPKNISKNTFSGGIWMSRQILPTKKTEKILKVANHFKIGSYVFVAV